MKTNKVTRVEVIDETWRAYVNMEIEDVICSLQDDDRTLKIFIKKIPWASEEK